jgi:hypothetical protein
MELTVQLSKDNSDTSTYIISGYEMPNFFFFSMFVNNLTRNRNQSIILFKIIIKKSWKSHGYVIAKSCPSIGQVMAKSWLSHGQDMASHGKSCQSNSCHLKPNVCPSHGKSLPLAKSNGINFSKICTKTKLKISEKDFQKSVHRIFVTLFYLIIFKLHP